MPEFVAIVDRMKNLPQSRLFTGKNIDTTVSRSFPIIA